MILYLCARALIWLAKVHTLTHTRAHTHTNTLVWIFAKLCKAAESGWETKIHLTGGGSAPWAVVAASIMSSRFEHRAPHHTAHSLALAVHTFSHISVNGATMCVCVCDSAVVCVCVQRTQTCEQFSKLFYFFCFNRMASS